VHRSDTPLKFSLVRGDALFRMQRAIGLVPAGSLGLVRRAAFWAMVGWLPVALWALFRDRALPGALPEPLLVHFGVHARLLIAVPVLILAQGPAQAVVDQVLRQLLYSGVVPVGQRARFDHVVRGVVRLRDSTIPWVAIVAVALAVLTVSGAMDPLHEADWDRHGLQAGSLGFGGLWFLYVGRSIYFVLACGWIWHIVLLTVLLRRIARLDLSLVPSHADRAGGLGFLERLPGAFAPAAFAASCVLASRWAHDAVYHGLQLASLRAEMIAFVAFCVALFALPLLALRKPLKEAKQKALLDYGALIAEHGRLVHRRWIEGREIGQPAVLNAPELGPVADTAAMHEAVRAMRSIPLGKGTVAKVVLAAVAPMIAALALQMPIWSLVLALYNALI
jgi:hypothetical protein